MNNRIALAIGCIVLASASPCPTWASSESSSAGKIEVEADTDRFLPVTATGFVCVTATAGNLIGGAADFATDSGDPTAVPPIPPNFGAPSVPCTNTITKDPLAGKYDGRGLDPIAKFPAPVTQQGLMGLRAVGNKGGITDVSSAANWTSGTALFGFNNNADFNTGAQVTRSAADSPAGIGTGIASDPWIFTALELTKLDLKINLTNVNLIALADPGESSAAQIEVIGEFKQLFSEPTIASELFLEPIPFSFFKEIENNNSFQASIIPIFQRSFTLEAGATYSLEVQLKSAASGTPIPEPSSTLSFLTLGTLGAASALKRKQKFSKSTEETTKIG